ncbi:hypothetical protein CIL03_16260 [Virgibacillus indicus]|uniref:Sigma-54 factor interaction domain-containing protein n=1 Tax=Virgibacillus indicus TaxID=2024554 RepID=A0A265N6K3_9BACI|nr:sigma 54-interacting transcriptional regulator [Virgibacillus indicus]OZU87640.1 hypothetical protein CIL03_16260 [Virgibacillus indicus]
MDKIFKTVTDTINEGVMVIDSNFIFTYANKASNSIGLNNEKIIGKSIFDLFPYLNKDNSTFMQIFESKQPIIEKQQTFSTYRGEKKTTITSTYPLFQDGKVIGAFEIFRDITRVEALTDELRNLQLESNKASKSSKFQVKQKENAEEFVGESKEIRKLKSDLNMYANSLSPIFIYGETGTGKEVFVKAVHKEMTNGSKIPLITQNCAAIPENLLESYLFGTTQGS